MSVTNSESSRGTRLLLMLGAAAGLVTAVVGVIEPGPRLAPALPTGAAAVVDGVVIESADLDRAVEMLASDSKNPVGEEDRKHVLDRLIDEELLVQRARELGIDQHDRRVRSLLVQALIDSIVADAQGSEPSPADVAKFYQDEAPYFARTDRRRVRALRFARREGETDEQARARASQAVEARRSGRDRDSVQRELADPWLVPVPDALLPATKLREYLGPTPTRQALELDVDEVSEPVQGAGAWYVLEVVERVPEAVPPLESVEAEVRAEMQRRQGDTALRRYLDELRARSDVRVRASEPKDAS